MGFLSPEQTAFIPYRTSSYNCGILAPNGNIYFIPNSQTTILRVNPCIGQCDNTSMVLSEDVSTSSGWKSGILAPNGSIYCPPSGATSFLIINTNTNELDTTTIEIPNLSTVDLKWGGSCIAPNGKIYCTPVNETRVLVVDTNTNTYDLTTFTLDRGGYHCCCYSPSSNKVIAPPGNISTTNILIIDLNTNNADTTSTKLVGTYESIDLATNGRMYCAPFTLPVVRGPIGIITLSSTSVITNSTTLLLPAGNATLIYNYYYRGITASPDGNLYYMPGSNTMVIVVNTLTNRLDSTSLGGKFYEFEIVEPT